MELKRNLPEEAFTGVATFNRTSMELKQREETLHEETFLTFNRTSMELKLNKAGVLEDIGVPFNRTSMELKRLSRFP